MVSLKPCLPTQSHSEVLGVRMSTCESVGHSSAHNSHDTFYVDGLTIKRILLLFFMVLYSEESTELISEVSSSQN